VRWGQRAPEEPGSEVSSGSQEGKRTRAGSRPIIARETPTPRDPGRKPGQPTPTRTPVGRWSSSFPHSAAPSTRPGAWRVTLFLRGAKTSAVARARELVLTSRARQPSSSLQSRRSGYGRYALLDVIRKDAAKPNARASVSGAFDLRCRYCVHSTKSHQVQLSRSSRSVGRIWSVT